MKSRYIRDDALHIDLEKSLTHELFEKKLRFYYAKSLKSSAVDFDLFNSEWVSLKDLLLLIQWINLLADNKNDIRVIFPFTAFIHGVDHTEDNIYHEKAIYKPMYRRKKVSEFLIRLRVPEEVKRITGEYPVMFRDGKEIQSVYIDERYLHDYIDPYQERLLSVTPFTKETDLKVDEDFKNQQLRRILKEHSCLDAVDSGMLADVVIKELASNAILHGIKTPDEETDCNRKNESFHHSAWVSARLVKSSWQDMYEVPRWLEPVYKNLLGKHYVELVLSDSGFGIYNKLKDHVPDNFFKRKPTIKAVLDYAFDKFSSSNPKFRTELDRFPRGLFWVYDLVRQYGGVLIVRSSGYFVAYDFLNKTGNHRLLDLWNDSGKCLDIKGTIVQIILPEAKGLFITKPTSIVKRSFKESEIFIAEPPEGKDFELDDYVKKCGIEIEKYCRMNPDVPLIVDFASLSLADNQHVYFMIKMLYKVLYLEDPNLLLVLCPSDITILKLVNQYLLNKSFQSNTDAPIIRDYISSIFKDVGPHDLKICPVLLPKGGIFWLGASEKQSKYLMQIWNAGEEELMNFGDEVLNVVKMAKANTYLISLQIYDFKEKKGKATLYFNEYDYSHSLPNLLRREVGKIVESFPRTIYRKDWYHLPHGEYSRSFVSLYALFKKPNYLHLFTRYLLYCLAVNHNLREIDIVIGGTYSAESLIVNVAKELNSEHFVIERYVERDEFKKIGKTISGKSAIIVTDVVSTGSFVKEIECKLNQEGCTVEAICCICDLRIDQSQTIDSLFHFPTEKFEEPDGDNVYEINPISLRIVDSEKLKNRTITPSLITTDQLMEWVNNSKTLIAAHVVQGPTHYTYYVDTGKLLDKYSNEIFNTIVKDIEDNKLGSGKSGIVKTPSFLVLLKRSNVLNRLIRLFKEQFPHLEILELDRIRFSPEDIWKVDRLDEELDPVEKIKGSVVLVLDDGTNTGRTLIQMLSAVAEYKPDMVLAYVLVNRMSSFSSLFFNNVKKLEESTVDINYVANIPVGTFVRSNCPYCNLPSPKVPPAEEIQAFWDQEKEIFEECKWTRHSSEKIQEKSISLLGKRGIQNLDTFLSCVFEIRCKLADFEDRADIVTYKDRIKLKEIANDGKNLATLCYLFNREPNLLDSVLNYQIKNFDHSLFDLVCKVISNDDCKSIEGKQDIVEFVARRNPEFVLREFNEFIKKIMDTEKLCVIYLSYAIAWRSYDEIIQLFQKLKIKIESISKQDKHINFLRGLINYCLNWAIMTNERQKMDDLHGIITDLQKFYTSTHEGYGEYGGALQKIYTSLKLSERMPLDGQDYTLMYRNWRDYSASIAHHRLLPAIKYIEKILEIDVLLTGTLNYYILDGGCFSDYNEIEKYLDLFKRENNKEKKNLLVRENRKKLLIIIRRFIDYLFKDGNDIAKLVGKIPAYTVEKISQAIRNNQDWIDKSGIEVKFDEKDYSKNKEKYHTLITSTALIKILGEVFTNIRKNNFEIKDPNPAYIAKDKYRNHIINVNLERMPQDVVVITIGSDGPKKYNNTKGIGITGMKTKCAAFTGKFEIFNKEKWTQNRITLKGW